MSTTFYLSEDGKRIKLTFPGGVPKKIPCSPKIKISQHGISKVVVVSERELLLNLKVTKAGATASAFCFPQTPKECFCFSPFSGNRADFLHERRLWAEAFGSEDLRTGLLYGFDLDERYLRERAAIEFPGFKVVSDCGVEDDTALLDHTTLGVIHAFMKQDRRRLSGFRHMGSKLGIAMINNTPTVIVRGYLGLGDLTRPFSEVLNVVEPD